MIRNFILAIKGWFELKKFYNVKTTPVSNARIILTVTQETSDTEVTVLDNENRTLDDLNTALKVLCKGCYIKTGIYVEFIVTPAHYHYNEKWGCPTEGDLVFILDTVPGDNFTLYQSKVGEALFMHAIEFIADGLRKAFKQTELIVQFRREEIIKVAEKEETE